MVYDCFMFFNELELLEIRLEELDSIVDKFVVVESKLTHSGKPKELYYENNKDKFLKYRDKIIHIVVEFNDVIPWKNEFDQRNSILQGLKDCSDDDIIMISDVDEILNVNRLLEFFNGDLDSITYETKYICENQLYYYYLNTASAPDNNWIGTKILRYKTIKDYEYLPTEIVRNNNRGFRAKQCTLPIVSIHNCGWHFSYLGGVERVQKKMESFMHQELVNDKNIQLETIENNIKNLESVWDGRHIQLVVEDLSNQPNYIKNNIDTFNHLIYN